MADANVTIIGGGVIGLAVAYELGRTLDEVVLIEKNDYFLDDNQSTRNSGVIHAGIYYDQRKTPNKAKLCVEGNSLIYEFCESNNVPHLKTGKIVVATDVKEDACLDETLRIAEENGVPGIRRVCADEIVESQQNVIGTSGLYAPSSGVIDSAAFVRKLNQLAMISGVDMMRGAEVFAIEGGRRIHYRVKGGTDYHDSDIIINAAGLYSDEVAKMIDENSGYTILPMKGESAKFMRNRGTNMNIYPAPFYVDVKGERIDDGNGYQGSPDSRIKKSVGVHISPMVHKRGRGFILSDEVMVGPILAKGKDKQDYSHTHSFEKYVNAVKRFYPEICSKEMHYNQVGILAMLEGHPDFLIARSDRYDHCINLVGIDSPGLTSSLAIAKSVAHMIGRR